MLRRAVPLLLAFALGFPPLVAATHDDGGRGVAALGGATVPQQPDLLAIEAEDFATHDEGFLTPNDTATGGLAWELPSYGGMNATFDTPATGTVWFRIYAGGWHPDGTKNPHLHLYVDGLERAEADVRGGWGPYMRSLPLLAGHHTMRVESFNNYRDGGTGITAERTLLVDRVVIETPTLAGAPQVAPGGNVTVPAAQIHTALTGTLRSDFTALSGQAWWEWGVGCLAETWVARAAEDVTMTARVRGSMVNGEGTHVVIRQDGKRADAYFIDEGWSAHATRIAAAAGAHVLEVCYDNDRPGEKRDLYLDELSLVAGAEAPAWASANDGLANDRAPQGAITPQNAATAALAWRYRAAGPVTGTPAIADGVVYFGDGGGLVHALRLADGTEAWSVKHGAPIDSSVAVDGGLVLVSDAKGNVTALRRADGSEAWRTQVDATPGAHLYGSPVPHGGRVYQGVASEQTLLEWQGAQDFRGGVACLDEKTGAILWRAYTAAPGSVGVSVWSTPALDPALGLLYVGTGNAYAAPAGALSDAMVALRMDDGDVAWSYQATSNDTFNGRGGAGPDRDLGASPNLFDINGRAVVGEGDKGGVYHVLDRATGALVWRGAVNFSAPGYASSQVEGFLGTAAVADGVVYAPTTARAIVHALSAATGRVLWERELDPMPQTYGARMFGPATVTGGVVLQGASSGRVFLLDARTGDVLANLSAGGSVEGGIAVAGATFVVPDVGADLWSGGGGVSAYRLNATPMPLPFPSPNPSASPSPSPSPSAGDIIHVTNPPSESAAPGQAGVVNGRVPGPAPWLVIAAALGALATRGARRR